MRKIVIVAGLFIAALSSKAQTLPTAGQKAVTGTLTKLFDAISALDSAQIALYTTKDIIILESGAVWNMDSLNTILNRMKSVSFKRTNEMSFVRTEITGNIAWVVYHNTAHMTMSGQQRDINWLESAVLKKDGDAWKVCLLHSTTLAPPNH
jgi:ketosteroid isomerase-like protein